MSAQVRGRRGRGQCRPFYAHDPPAVCMQRAAYGIQLQVQHAPSSTSLALEHQPSSQSTPAFLSSADLPPKYTSLPFKHKSLPECVPTDSHMQANSRLQA